MAIISGRNATVYVNRGTPDAPQWVRVAGGAPREERMDFLRHPEYLAILAAVLADPADDAPRLVAADWLDERPENAARLYAEFIRVQVEAAALVAEGQSPPSAETGKCDDARCKPCRLWRLYRRERELLSRHAAPWSAPWEGIFAAALPRNHVVLPPIFRRGFIGEVMLPEKAFFKHAAALFLAQPVELAVLSDKYPWHQEGSNKFIWTQHRCGPLDSWLLPPELFDLLLPDPACVAVWDSPESSRGGSQLVYATDEDAIDGLARAAARFGRAAAHLPPLPAPDLV